MKKFLERVSRVLFVVGASCFFVPIINVDFAMKTSRYFFVAAGVILFVALILALVSLSLRSPDVVNKNWQKAMEGLSQSRTTQKA